MEDFEADETMRQMMGFGSFGNNKKRQKLNIGSSNPQIPQKPPATSSNSTPLGSSKKRHIKKQEPSSISSHNCSSSLGWTAAKLPNPVPVTEDDAPDVLDRVSTPNLSHDTNFIQPETNNPAKPTEPLPDILAPSSHVETTSNEPDNSTPRQTYISSDIRSEPSYWQSRSSKHTFESEVGYTSPWTGATMTRKDLKEYGSGRRELQSDGSIVSVFFKPGFLATEEELWGRWQGQT